jgi:hypothetical protein
MHLFSKVVLFIILLFGIGSINAQTTKEEMSANVNKTAGVYYAYPVIAPVAQTAAPKGYKPFYISHYGRHGSRYMINDNDYKWVLDLFADAHQSKALTVLGEEVYGRLQKVWAEAEERAGDLSPLGVNQQRGIAERIYNSYPEVFKGKKYILARSTMVMRCAMSMDAFCERLKELNPQLQITHEPSTRFLYYMSHRSDESAQYTSNTGPWYEQYRKFEESHTHPARLIPTLFVDSDYVNRKVNPATLMHGLFNIAGDMQDIETKVSFYDLFTKDELFDLWQCLNYRFYVCFANSSINKGKMIANAKPLLKNILDSADKAIHDGSEAATLRFGHDVNITPLVSLMRLENYDVSISDPARFYQVWSDFKVSPMGANVQLIFYRKEHSDDILVKIRLNEQEVHIPLQSVSGYYYHWSDVEKLYRNILNAE